MNPTSRPPRSRTGWRSGTASRSKGRRRTRASFEPEPSRLGGLTGWPALCWLLRHPEKPEFTASEVEEITKIPAADLPAAFRVFDVQRYATRYEWSLEGEGPGLLLKQLKKAGLGTAGVPGLERGSNSPPRP